MFKFIITVFFSFATLNLLAQTEKIKFYLNSSNNQSDLARSGEQMKVLVENETGLELELEVITSHKELVSKFGQGKPCFGFLNSYSYVVANTKYGAKAKLRTIRYGIGLYSGMIIAN